MREYFVRLDELDQTMRRRWGWALREWRRVTSRETQRYEQRAGKAAAMLYNSGLGILAAQPPKHPEDDPSRLWEKSKLFGRLLRGMRPYYIPPPISYSYPWFEIIDDWDKPHRVVIDGLRQYDDGTVVALLGGGWWPVVERSDTEQHGIPIEMVVRHSCWPQRYRVLLIEATPWKDENGQDRVTCIGEMRGLEPPPSTLVQDPEGTEPPL